MKYNIFHANEDKDGFEIFYIALEKMSVVVVKCIIFFRDIVNFLID